MKSCLWQTTRTWSLEVEYKENQANFTELELVSFKKLLSTLQLLVLTLAEKLNDPTPEGPRLRPAPHKSSISVTLFPKTTAVSTLIAKTNGIKTGTKKTVLLRLPVTFPKLSSEAQKTLNVSQKSSSLQIATVMTIAKLTFY
ncbi:hypothetical protein [Nostoc sp.]|uniref:hypothetical protein n=1 Tax=Nostoc sp. TaxID=1180 RepID=UPI002FFC318C